MKLGPTFSWLLLHAFKNVLLLTKFEEVPNQNNIKYDIIMKLWNGLLTTNSNYVIRNVPLLTKFDEKCVIDMESIIISSRN